jgi:hypothetical protein
MEPADKERLEQARGALERELQMLSCRHVPRALTDKLRSQLREIKDLLTGLPPEPDPNVPLPKAAALSEGALLYELDGEPDAKKIERGRYNSS